jgi:iron complex transport system substrate-binding protein
MRIVSLLPSTTEIAFALGLGAQVVAVTHECDYPPAARDLPVITSSALDHPGASSAAIDAVVRAQLRDDLSIYRLDHDVLARLAPDLILTQALCEVCAVSFSTVEQAVAAGDLQTQILSLEPVDVEGILGTILAVSTAAGVRERGLALVATLRKRIERIRERATTAVRRPRVLCLEWFDPLFGPGHWLPELVTLAGGICSVGEAAAPSRRIDWNEVIAARPDVIVLTACGFDLDRATAEAAATLPHHPAWNDLPAVRENRVVVVDGNAYFSRPGPRIVESLELMAEIVHPGIFAGYAPAGSYRYFEGGPTGSPARS